ncbi:hypothetical protein D3P06_01160 [Paracoccus aestuarii]|uniref:Nitrous-oxide reductase n=1 Tax=Paracoccus aestuarii TaxID=453842 RepID=A0A419A2V2_9RHOB|nr:hypothetical protein [Paracoccus aestuarii]RJL07375.1 hypothetical protein D3P06_01160 [Paracoccus aestuarii]WCR00003.1 hypothetical protein JHW48_04625 [Paracoccus aestuarii]
MSETRHPTTRRGFIAAFGFGGVSLYALWAAYGAAPGPLALFGRAAPADADRHGTDDQATGGHAHGATSGGPSADDFRRTVAEFVERHRAEDGVVHPRRPAQDGHADAAPAPSHGAHGGHDEATAQDHDGGDEPVEVYMLAEKWFYEPTHLRLDAGTRYRFRMMATDVSHGASIQFGRGGRMIRLRPNAVAEMEAVFARPGSFLVYCTVYCGAAHDYMQARIDVV